MILKNRTQPACYPLFTEDTSRHILRSSKEALIREKHAVSRLLASIAVNIVFIRSSA